MLNNQVIYATELCTDKVLMLYVTLMTHITKSIISPGYN